MRNSSLETGRKRGFRLPLQTADSSEPLGSLDFDVFHKSASCCLRGS